MYGMINSVAIVSYSILCMGKSTCIESLQTHSMSERHDLKEKNYGKISDDFDRRFCSHIPDS